MSEEAEAVDTTSPVDVPPETGDAGEPVPPAAEETAAPDPAPAPEQAADGESASQTAPEAPSDPPAESPAPDQTAPVADEAPATDGAPEQQQPEKESVEPAAIEGTLHVAARAGSVDSIKMLLKNGADPLALDAEGRTALSIAEECGHAEVVTLLNEASPNEAPAQAPSTPAQPEPEAPSSFSKKDSSKSSQQGLPAQNQPALPKSPKQSPLFGASTPSPAASPSMKSRADASPAGHSLRADVERILGGFDESTDSLGEEGSMSRKKPPLIATTEGVVKGPTYMVAHSKWKASPKWSMVPRGPSFMNRASSAPAPGTYDLPSTEKTKFKTGPRFGFGIGSRFGLDEDPASRGKHMPGPASYNPKKIPPGTKVGFGTSVRSAMGLSGGFAPGPGAYEQKSSIGQGMMFTAKGKHSSAYMKRSASAPGPGAYTPSIRFAYKEAPKCGFGTSSRDSEHARAARTQGNPGPGAYEMQYHAGIGRDAVKYSATSRRRVHDLNSYLTPGPGTYNAHVTSFGY